MRPESPCHIWHVVLDLGDPVLTLFNLQLNVIVCAVLVSYICKSLSVLKFIGYVSCTTLKVALFFNQWTPLHAAADNGCDYTVECLLKRGANINMKDKAGVSMTILLNYGR